MRLKSSTKSLVPEELGTIRSGRMFRRAVWKAPVPPFLRRSGAGLIDLSQILSSLSTGSMDLPESASPLLPVPLPKMQAVEISWERASFSPDRRRNYRIRGFSSQRLLTNSLSRTLRRNQ